MAFSEGLSSPAAPHLIPGVDIVERQQPAELLDVTAAVLPGGPMKVGGRQARAAGRGSKLEGPPGRVLCSSYVVLGRERQEGHERRRRHPSAETGGRKKGRERGGQGKTDGRQAVREGSPCPQQSPLSAEG